MSRYGFLAILFYGVLTMAAFGDEASGQTVPPGVAWKETFGARGGQYATSVRETTDEGYILTGTSSSDRENPRTVYLLKTDAQGNALWEEAFGPGVGRCVRQTADGGYILAGTKAEVFAITWRNDSAYLIKTDPQGILQWEKAYSKETSNSAHSVQQTQDGGYILVGSCGVSGVTQDVYLIKTDEEGFPVWQKTFNRKLEDIGYSVQEATDGGFIVTGMARDQQSIEVYLLRTDVDGNRLWEKTLGSGVGRSVQKTSDNGYVIAGSRLIKTDNDGNLLWEQTWGDNDYASAVQETGDGGYIAVGSSNSPELQNQVYLTKTDSGGNLLWERFIGGEFYEDGYSVQETGDGGYIIAGRFAEYVRKPEFEPQGDIYLLKTDKAGTPLWQKTFGKDDHARSVHPTSDGGYLVSGGTRFSSLGRYDAYFIKTDSKGQLLWELTFGGEGSESGRFVEEADDGGFILQAGLSLIKTDMEGSLIWEKPGIDGERTSDGGYLIVNGRSLSKTDSQGNLLWEKVLGCSTIRDVQPTSDGGCILTFPPCGGYGGAPPDLGLARYDQDGNGWEKRFQFTGSGLAVQESSDGGFLVAGETLVCLEYSCDVLSRVGLLVQVDRDGDLVWERTFQEFHCFYGIEKDGDEIYLLRSESSLVQVDSEGNLLWQKDILGGIPHAVQRTIEGGYIVAGKTGSHHQEGSDLFLLKLGTATAIPGDCAQDGELDISDCICLLGHLFLGSPDALPCGDGTLADPANNRLLDLNDDADVDLSDAVHLLGFLYLGSEPPVLGTECAAIPSCPGVCNN